MVRNANADISQLIHTDGFLTRVFADFPTDDVEAPAPGPRLTAITHALQVAGSPESDIDTVTAALDAHSADRDQIPRLLMVHDGELLLDELLPDAHLQADEASFDQLPALVPLVTQRQLDIPYVVLEASAGGGRIRTFFAGDLHADSDEHITGETEHLHEAHGGSYAHFRHAHHTEEVWKRNERELAGIVDRLVERNDVRLIVVTGDPHVVELVRDALSSRAQAILATFPSDTVAAGSSAEKLDAFVADQLRGIVRNTQTEAIDRAASQAGASDSGIDSGLQPIVQALQQARAETLLLDLEALESHSLLCLAGEPWVAAVADESFGATILGTVSAAEALTRAAIVTGADVVLVEPGTLPGHAGAAVIHR